MKRKSFKTAIHIFLLVSLLGMLSATLFTSYAVYQEYQYKQSLLCSDITDGLTSIRSDAFSDNPQIYRRHKAIKLIAAIFTEMRTGMPLIRLSPDTVALEMNDLTYMCSAYPDYNIGQIVRHGSDSDLKERSRFNREFGNMIGWQKVDQNFHITEVGYWLLAEAKKRAGNHFLNIAESIM